MNICGLNNLQLTEWRMHFAHVPGCPACRSLSGTLALLPGMAVFPAEVRHTVVAYLNYIY